LIALLVQFLQGAAQDAKLRLEGELNSYLSHSANYDFDGTALHAPLPPNRRHLVTLDLQLR